MLVLIRHGRTSHNASGRLLGRADPPLDQVGLEQAGALGQFVGRLADEGNHHEVHLVSSPLLRCSETSSAIAAATGAPTHLDERWIELDYGELDGMAMRDVPAELWGTWRSDPNFTPPGGESLVELRSRVEVAIEDLVVRAQEALVVVVSHVSPIKAAVAWALDADDDVVWRLFLHPAGVSRVALSAAGPSLVTFNEQVLPHRLD